MAIQEVEKREAQGTAGKRRKINAAAEGMVMDIVQAQQYQYPIPSTIRELTANAVDSQSEKERALEILSGQATPDKYFIKRDGALYADSKWDPSYYNPEHLNKDVNQVEIIYREGSGGGLCDTLIIRDHGVGIGGRRLEGVLEIGYSTKRNRKDALGAFGLGAKVGLSTGADYYTITSVYNGVKHKLQVFNRKVNSVIPKLNFDTGGTNVPYTFSDGEVIYGEKTTEKNYTQIEVGTKAHHKAGYIEAVKTQLLYFPNVTFHVESESGDRTKIHFLADITYNSDNLVVSKNSPYSKPHVVIVKGGEDIDKQTGVCYGHINFQEMELEDMFGDIGIKCPIRQVLEDENGNEIVINEGVDVNPSRETIRWTPATTEFLKKQFKQAQDEATTLVEKELQQTDFLKWLEACRNISSFSGQDSVLGRLSKIVELGNVRPKFKDTKIKFGYVKGLFRTFNVVMSTKYQDKDDKLFKVKRDDKDLMWHNFNFDAVYFKVGKATRYRDVYAADQASGTFITLQPISDEGLKGMAKASVQANKLKFPDQEKWVKKMQQERDLLVTLLKASEYFKDYDALDVPQSYIDSLTKIEQELPEGEEEEAPKLSAKQRRELEQRVVCNTFVERYIAYDDPKQTTKTYQYSKREPKYQEILDDKATIYYGYQGDESKLQYAAHILHQLNWVNQLEDAPNETTRVWKENLFYNDRYKLLSVSKSNKKHFSMHNHIDDFFGKAELVKKDGQVVGCNIVMDNAVVHWNTARRIKDVLGELRFMHNFRGIDEDVYADYERVVKYVDRYNRNLTEYAGRFAMTHHHNQFTQYLDKVEKIQQMAASSATDEEIAEYVKEASLPTGITGGLAVNTAMLELVEKLRAYAGPIQALFNRIPDLTCINPRNNDEMVKRELNMSVSMYIQEIIDWKGCKYETEKEDTVNSGGEEGSGDDSGGAGPSQKVEEQSELSPTS